MTNLFSLSGEQLRKRNYNGDTEMKHSRLFIASVAFAALAVFASGDAIACRDCPFPMRVAKDQWLMPNSKVLLEVIRTEVSEKTHLLNVLLKDRATGEILASGSVIRKKSSRTVNISLLDHLGYRVLGYIHWMDSGDDYIQVRFACDGTCSIADVL